MITWSFSPNHGSEGFHVLQEKRLRPFLGDDPIDVEDRRPLSWIREDEGPGAGPQPENVSDDGGRNRGTPTYSTGSNLQVRSSGADNLKSRGFRSKA